MLYLWTRGYFVEADVNLNLVCAVRHIPATRSLTTHSTEKLRYSERVSQEHTLESARKDVTAIAAAAPLKYK